ncbi:leukocyte elastase inhibitor-like [Limulus polyphemus]|uniref:Leukocyte elastase inhibitor-like n=1 Tax=Limulus polyphemus TaxID=6850 RepID=A0ABM1B9G0_LIMPO|nr:leukocyte elastase inhibitor-like [Limulus polyphemus]
MMILGLLILLVTCPFSLLFEFHHFDTQKKELLEKLGDTGIHLDSLSGAIKVTNASNNFGLTLYHALPDSGNLFISPFSLSTVLTMAYLGARNSTAQQMSYALGYSRVGLDASGVLSGLQQTNDLLNSQKNSYDLEAANAVLVQRGLGLLAVYQQALTEYLGAVLQEVDFATEEVKVQYEVNSWASRQTKNKISKLLDKPLPKDSLLALLNAVYFKGTWQTMFDQKLTQSETFYNNGRTPVTVRMMHSKSKFPFFYDSKLGVYALEMPYRGSHISMLILLPDNRNGLLHLEDALSIPYLQNIYNRLQDRRVEVAMPRFKLEAKYEDDLKRTLQQMGMSDVFDPSRANLAGITRQRGLYLTKVIHKSYIEVNEEGSEAAAVSVVVGAERIGGRNDEQFIANHPFIFLIRDYRTGLILFLGRVNEL